tara:strand:+ start:3631 stop:4242 length:612 start_codon:yes stop_codon:yes gene_type:complete
MWYFKEKIINSPTTITIGELRYGKEIFEDADKLKELGIKPYREVRPDRRYWDMGQVIFDTSGDEVVATYPKKGKDVHKLKSNMLKLIKRQLTTKLESTDWYYLRKLRTGNDVPSDIQNYSDTLYSEYDTKKTEIGLMMKMSQIKEFENKSFTEVRKVKSTNTEGKTVYGPKTESTTRHINMCTQWTSNPNDDIDPAFVSLTAD